MVFYYFGVRMAQPQAEVEKMVEEDFTSGEGEKLKAPAGTAGLRFGGRNLAETRSL